MDMNTNDVQTLLEFLDEEWLMVLFRLICSGVAFALLINVVQSLAAYINLRLDHYLRRGTLLELDGNMCRVKAIRIFRVELEFKRGYMTIPTRLWKDQNYLVLKDIAAMQNVKHYKVEGDLNHRTDREDHDDTNV